MQAGVGSFGTSRVLTWPFKLRRSGRSFTILYGWKGRHFPISPAGLNRHCEAWITVCR